MRKVSHRTASSSDIASQVPTANRIIRECRRLKIRCRRSSAGRSDTARAIAVTATSLADFASGEQRPIRRPISSLFHARFQHSRPVPIALGAANGDSCFHLLGDAEHLLQGRDSLQHLCECRRRKALSCHAFMAALRIVWVGAPSKRQLADLRGHQSSTRRCPVGRGSRCRRNGCSRDPS